MIQLVTVIIRRRMVGALPAFDSAVCICLALVQGCITMRMVLKGDLDTCCGAALRSVEDVASDPRSSVVHHGVNEMMLYAAGGGRNAS